MRRSWWIAALLIACGPGKPEAKVQPDVTTEAPKAHPDVPSAPRAQPGVTPEAPKAQPDVAPEAPKAQPDPAPAPTPSLESTPSEPDDKTLERTPGLTPTLPLVRSAAPKAHKDLAGTPGESPAMGASDAEALVRVFVFSDFQCPVCRRAVEPLKKLVRAFPGEVQVVFKQHPLASHGRAEPAARASLAAMAQGRFWEMHDRLFDAQRALEDADLAAHAQALGLDMVAFDKALADPKLAAQIAYESAQAEALDARGTPAFFVNGERTVGWGSYLGIESQVKRALETAREQLAKGVPRAEVARRATAERDPAAASILFGDP